MEEYKFKEYDAFISHATEDKATIVRELADSLLKKGYNIWYDELSLQIGDSLRKSIDLGLKNSRYGIIILSKAFFIKAWPNYELNGLVSLNIERPGILLPIWHEVTKEHILDFSPPLADIVSLSTNNLTVKEIAENLEKILGEDIYDIDEKGGLRKANKKSAVNILDRQRGFQTILSNQTDRIINKKETIIRSEVIILPLDRSLSNFEFHHWQDAKGEMELIRSNIYDKLSGNIVRHDDDIEQNDGNKFILRCSFKLEAAKPLNIITEIKVSNYFPNLFTIGTGYTEFKIIFPIRYFRYNLIMPNKREFCNMDIFANDLKLEQNNSTSEITVEFHKRLISIGQKLKFTINNKNFK